MHSRSPRKIVEATVNFARPPSRNRRSLSAHALSSVGPEETEDWSASPSPPMDIRQRISTPLGLSTVYTVSTFAQFLKRSTLAFMHQNIPFPNRHHDDCYRPTPDSLVYGSRPGDPTYSTYRYINSNLERCALSRKITRSEVWYARDWAYRTAACLPDRIPWKYFKTSLVKSL